MAGNARDMYKLPFSIDVTVLDSPISFRKGEMGPKKPITIRSIGVAVLGGGIWAFFFNKTMSSDFGLFNFIGFSLGYWSLVGMAARLQDNGQMGYKWFWPTIKYWMNYKERSIKTGPKAEDNDLQTLNYEIPIDTVEADNGIIHFTDGSSGVVLSVVGFGSQALFIDERNMVINSFSKYLRDLKEGTTFLVDTKQSSENVDDQIKYLQGLRDDGLSPQLEQIASERQRIFEKVIAKNFHTITQNIFLRAENETILAEEIKWLDIQTRQRMLRDSVLLTNDKLFEALSNFYKLE